MKCAKCGKEFSDNLFLCPHCGANIDTSGIKNVDLLKKYSENLQTLIKNVGSAQHNKIAWDMTVDKYVRKMEQLRIVLSQPEFSKVAGKQLISRISNFVERCKDPFFHIAFVGTIKSGKSTLINALLGRNLASTAVTPETAVLTKFRSNPKDYVKVTFYSSDEWSQLWNSISTNADVFLQEYKTLNAEAVKSKWLDHKEIVTETNNENIENEIERWSSSKHVEHYFVKEVEIGLSTFNLPQQIVFVDTPGLDDAVKYRSDVTRSYIDRANAVFACVRSDALTGGELNTLYRIFSNSSENPEKIFILGTQWDNLNNPEQDWKLQKEEWIKYLSTENCYGNAKTASRNIFHVAAYLSNLVREYDHKDKNMRKKLVSVAMKLSKIDDPYEIMERIEELLTELDEKSNVSEVHRRIQMDIIPKYKEYLMRDIMSAYEAISGEIHTFFEETRSSNEEVLATSMKSANEIRESYEKSKKELDDIQAYREQLEVALNQLKANTDQRVEQLCKLLENMVEKS